MKQVSKLIVLTLTCLLNTTWTRAQGNMDYEMCITIRQHPRNEGASSGALSLEGSPVLRGPHGEEGGSRMCRCNTSKQQKDEIQALHETNKRLKQQIANNPNCERNASRPSQAGTGGQGWNAGDQYPNRQQQQPMMGQQQPMMDGYGRGQGIQYPNGQRQPMMGQQQQMMGGYGRDSGMQYPNRQQQPMMNGHERTPGMQYPNRQQQMMGQQQPMMGGNGMNPGFHYSNGQQQQMMGQQQQMMGQQHQTIGGYGRTQGTQYPNRQQQGRMGQQQSMMGQQQPMMGQQQPMMGLQRPNQQQPMMGQQQPMMGGYGRAPGMQYPNRQQQMMGQQQPMTGGYGRNPGGQYPNQQQPMIDQRQPMMGGYGRNPGMQYPSQQSQPGIGQQQPMMGDYGGNQGLQYPMQDSQMGMGRYERAVGPQNSTGRGDEGMDASDGEQARPPNPSRGPPAVTGGGESMNSDVQHLTTMPPPVTNRSEETGGRQNEVEEPSQPMTGENNGTSDLGNGSEDYESEEVVEYETAAEYVEHCAVGMKDGRVSDDDIEASSAYSDDHGANHARLDYGVKPGQLGHQAWSSLTKTQGEWIQVDLKSPALVTGVITQGRRDAHKSQWVTSFKISYGNSTSEMEAMRDGDGNEIIFTGNTDRNTYVMNRFPHTVVASYVRLIVWEWFGYISMRLEFITC